MKREGEARGEVHEAMSLLSAFERAGTDEERETAWSSIEEFFMRENVNSLTMRLVMRGLEQTGKLDDGFRERFETIGNRQEVVRKARLGMGELEGEIEEALGGEDA